MRPRDAKTLAMRCRDAGHSDFGGKLKGTEGSGPKHTPYGPQNIQLTCFFGCPLWM